MIQPNQLEQATKELSKINLGAFEIPNEISEKQAPYYNCIGVKAAQSKDGMSTTYSAKLLYAMPALWQEMEREAKSGRVKGMFNGVFNKIVILHNPTIKPKKNKGGRPKVNKEETK
jgi:hypothetical protein